MILLRPIPSRSSIFIWHSHCWKYKKIKKNLMTEIMTNISDEYVVACLPWFFFLFLLLFIARTLNSHTMSTVWDLHVSHVRFAAPEHHYEAVTGDSSFSHLFWFYIFHTLLTIHFSSEYTYHDLIMRPYRKIFLPTRKANHLFMCYIFFCYFVSVTHNSLFIPLFCITNGLRIRTNQSSPNYQEGNGCLNKMCQRKNWQRSDSGPGDGVEQCLYVTGGKRIVPLETNTISY